MKHTFETLRLLKTFLYFAKKNYFKELKCVIVLLTLGIISQYAPQVDSSKILAAYPFPGKSHFSMHNALIEALIKKGHQVTMITAFTLKPLKLGSNYTEILIDPPYDFWSDIKPMFSSNNLFELTKLNTMDFVKMLKIIGTTTTEYALQQPKVQELIHAKKTDGVFDLLLAEQFYQEPFLALAYIYNIPIVTSSTSGFQNIMSQQMGIITPWSFVPHGFMPFTDKMNFIERLTNTFYSLYADLEREFRYFPMMDKMVDKYFSHLPVKLPKVSKMEQKVSVMLLNNHVPLTTVRPSAGNMILVGGLHLKPAKRLPDDMQKFLDGADHGAIYFSLGTQVESKDMPDEKLKLFLEVFGSMKQRVVWKFENESLPDIPANVMVKKWMPQPDILGHPNVKVFITHGGLFGTQEGVYNAVPLLGMPFYCDQHLNMKKAVQGGYAINLHFQSITKEILKESLLELIENPSYKQNMQRVSEVFRDRPMNARDTAVYWIEHVIRHKGAAHLRSAGLDLSWYQFYLLDVIAFVAAWVFLAIALLVFLVRLIIGGSKATKKQKRQ